MGNQKEFFAYNKAGAFVGVHVCSKEDLNELGLVSGSKPPKVLSTDPRDYPLTQRRFNTFIAEWGYDDAIDAILQALKSSEIGTPERKIYARIKGDVLGAKEFRFQVLLDLISNPMLAPLVPQDVDTSEKTLAPRWMLAQE